MKRKHKAPIATETIAGIAARCRSEVDSYSESISKVREGVKRVEDELELAVQKTELARAQGDEAIADLQLHIRRREQALKILGEAELRDLALVGAEEDVETTTAQLDKATALLDKAETERAELVGALSTAQGEEERARAADERVTARGRVLAAQQLVDEQLPVLEAARAAHKDAVQRHDLATGELGKLELERLGLIAAASKTLSGEAEVEAEERRRQEAEEEARRNEEAKARASAELAKTMMGGPTAFAQFAAARRLSQQKDGRVWHGLYTAARGNNGG